MGSPVCDPIWQKLLLCSERSAGVSSSARRQGKYLTHAQQRKLIKMMEKYEYDMNKYLESFTEGYENYEGEYPPS